MLNAVQEVKI